MNEKEFVNETKRLNLCAAVKAELVMLYHTCRDLAVKIIKALAAHKEMITSILLGAIVAYLCTMLPIFGTLAALVSLVTSAAIGMLAEIKDHLQALFEIPIPA